MKLLQGGKLSVRELKAFLESSYMQPAPDEVMGYTLDKELSNLYGKVYFNESLKKVVVAFRGTTEPLDWGNNLTYAMSTNAYRLTPRFGIAKKMADKAQKKYKGWQFEFCGHSQGTIPARMLGDKAKNVFMLNPAFKNESLSSNHYLIRSSGDLVSQLSVGQKFKNSILYPSWTANHMITIENKTGNPLTEHAIDILDRLDPNRSIGRGGNIKKESKPCTCEKKKQLDGYSLNVCLSK